MRIRYWIDQLEQIRSPAVFNPYRDHCSRSDLENAAQLRSQNLEQYLEVICDQKPRTAWIGEALGYRGGRRTGLPFSDDRVLDQYGAFFGIQPQNPTTDQMAETTAGVIWGLLEQLDEPVFLWNCYPLHPHEPGVPLSNRRPLVRELSQIRRLQKELFSSLQFETIYAIGRAPELELERIGLAPVYVRHPSYGGITEFREKIRDEYQLDYS